MTYPTRRRSPRYPHGDRASRRFLGLFCAPCDGAAPHHPRSCRCDCHDRTSFQRYDYSKVEVRLPDGRVFPRQVEVAYDDQVDASHTPRAVGLLRPGIIKFEAAEAIEPGQLVAVDESGRARAAFMKAVQEQADSDLVLVEARGQGGEDAFHGPIVAAGEWAMPEDLDAGDIARSAAAFDHVLHPNGRCTCAGEGHCDWCQLHEQLNPEEGA